MKRRSTVLLVGWNPDVVDCSKWPGLTAEKLRAALEADRRGLRHWATMPNLVSLIALKRRPISDCSKQNRDCVLIGAGVRTIPEYLIFEAINTFHECAPNANFASTAAHSTRRCCATVGSCKFSGSLMVAECGLTPRQRVRQHLCCIHRPGHVALACHAWGWGRALSELLPGPWRHLLPLQKERRSLASADASYLARGATPKPALSI